MAEGKYKRAEDERAKYVNAVLASKSAKKVVVAGPGTGKTHLFKKVLEGTEKSLTLTFINALVDELSIDLYGMSEVRTLHSFAAKLFGRLCPSTKFQIFGGLSALIRDDYLALTGENIDFTQMFHTRDDDNQHIELYRRRKEYYEHSYGHSDIVFATATLLEKFQQKIPVYDQIVVDEFQDFNPLEVSFIELLASKSPILLAGDDDQAIYDRKHASPEHIRKRYRGDFGYKGFELPYCGRCTRVVVEAANDVVKAAVAHNLLKGRVAKRFEYFDDEVKDKECARFPAIAVARLQERQTSHYIEKELKELAGQMGEAFKKASVLVIAPMRTKARSITTLLKRRGFQNLDFVDREIEINIIDGLKVLLKDRKSNLGWRIVAEKMMDPNAFKDCLKRTFDDRAPAFEIVVSAECKKTTKELLSILRKVRAGKATSSEAALLEANGINHLKLGTQELAEELRAEGRRKVGTGLRKTPIKVTTIKAPRV
jgi:superfamily I DNA/RNA helicase